MPRGRIQFGEFELDCDRYELLRAGQSIKLEKLPMELLVLLIERGGHLVTRQEIIQRLWGQDVFLDTEHGINTAIFKLRAVLGENGDKSRFIQTVTGKGYRFVAPASVVSAGSNGSKNHQPPAVAASSLAVAPRVGIAEQVSATQSATPVRWRKKVAVVGGIVGLMALVGLIASGILWKTTVRILDSQQITYSTEHKGAPLFTDGARLYFQGQEGAVEMSVNGGPIAPLRGSTAGMRMLDVSPDGSQLLAIKQNLGDESESGEIWSVPVLGGVPKRVGKETISDARWMPDGRSVIYTYVRSVFITGPDGANPKLVWQAPGNAYDPSLSPDGRRIRLTVEENHPLSQVASTSRPWDQDLKIWEINIDGSHAHRLLADWPTEANHAGRWTPDGKHFIFLSDAGGTTNIYELIEPGWRAFWKKPTAAKLTSGEMEVVDATASRDSRQLFVMGRLPQGAMQVFDPQQKRFVPFLGGLAASEFVISPDRQWMAYTDFPRHFLWRSRLDGSEKLQLTSSYAAWPRWSPDGKSIVYMDWQSIYLIPSEGGTAEKLIGGGAVATVAPVAPEWTPDGKAITFNDYPHVGTKLKGVQVLDLATRSLSVFPGSEGFYVGSWSPDGQYMVALAQDPLRMMLYKLQTHSWSELKRFDVPWGYWVWTRDSRSLLCAQIEQASGIYRLTIADGGWERIATLDGIHIDDLGDEGFLNLTADGQPAIMNDTSVVQIYSLQWK